MKKIKAHWYEVPERLNKDFLNLLDIVQSLWTQNEVDNLSDNEQQVISMIEKWVGKDRAERYTSKKEKQKSVKQLEDILW